MSARAWMLAPPGERRPESELEGESTDRAPAHSGEVDAPPCRPEAEVPRQGDLEGDDERPLMLAQQKLMLSVRGLVAKKIQERVPWAKADFRNELYQRAMLYLTKAVRRFDPGLGKEFVSYAVPWILGAIRDMFEEEDLQEDIKAALKEPRARGRRARSGREAARRYLAERPDPTEMLIEDDETSLARLDALTARTVSAMCIGTVVEFPEADEAPEERLAGARLRRRMDAVLKTLMMEEHLLLSRKFLQARTHDQIAAEMNAATKTVQRHLDSLLDKLRAILAEAGETELPKVRF